MAILAILTTKIRQLDGLYSLNDLHKAAGGEKKNTPSRFIRNEQTITLIQEIDQNPNLGLAIKTNHGGSSGGTYVCKELVYAYAMWINADFYLQVIRAYDQITQQPALSQPKQYNYPRRLLEQSGFITEKISAGLNISMLANTKAFISPLFHLLNELRTEGHNVDAPWDEAMAMREGLIKADEVLDEISMNTLRARMSSASTALRNK